MAIVSFSKKYIFIKTRKTAGTSIQASLLPYCSGSDIVTREWTNLLTGRTCVIEEFASLEQIEHCFGVSRRDYFTFGFTRNPFDLTLSRYFYQIKMRRIRGPASKDDFNTWVFEVYFKGEPGFPGGRYLKDRSRYLLFDENLKPKVGFIGKFENLENDFEYVCSNIGVSGTKLAHVNQSNRIRVSYNDWLSDSNKSLVREKFAFEIEYFNYYH